MAALETVIVKGTAAAMPAPGIPGRLYFQTDTGRIFRDNELGPSMDWPPEWVDVTPTTGLPTGAANEFLATPNGASGQAALRSIVAADLPLATGSAPGAVQPDGTSITISGGVLSAVGGGGGSGSGALVNLGSVVLSSASATMSFASIPQTYNALKLIVVSQVNGTYEEGVEVNFNADFGANYYNAQSIGGAGTYNGASTGLTNAYAGAIVQAGSDPNDAAIAEILIPAYAGTAFHKAFLVHSTYRDSNNSGRLVVRTDGNSWMSTAAITSITLTASGGTQFQPGSSAILYGLN